MKLMVIEIKTYHQKNILTQLNLTWRVIIIDLQNSDTWKIQLTIEINYISSKDAEVECVMHSKSDNIKSTPYNNSNEVVDELFESLLLRFQGNLETSIELNEFNFDSVQLRYHKCHKVSFRLDKKRKNNNKSGKLR